jgi:hypothetical protein
MEAKMVAITRYVRRIALAASVAAVAALAVAVPLKPAAADNWHNGHGYYPYNHGYYPYNRGSVYFNFCGPVYGGPVYYPRPVYYYPPAPVYYAPPPPVYYPAPAPVYPAPGISFGISVPIH